MVLPVGAVFELKSIQKESFHDKIPYRGIYLNTSYDDLSLDAGWLSLAPSSKKVKIFTDSDIMKQKVLQTTSSDQVTVETILELSDRIDEVEKKVNDLSSRAVTKASDIQKDTFWYEENSVDPMELVFPTFSTVRFKSSYDTDRSADILIHYRNQEQGHLWRITCPSINVAQVTPNDTLPVSVIPIDQRKVIGYDVACRNRYLDYDELTGKYRDTFSYTDESSNELIPINYPLGDNAIFNDVEIREGYTLYLDDPSARIKIKKPKNV